MADAKISALPASTTPLAGTEVLPVVQSGTTKQVSVANLTAGRTVAASSFQSTGDSGFGTSSPAKRVDVVQTYRAQIDPNDTSVMFGAGLVLAGDNGTNQSGAKVVAGYSSGGFGLHLMYSTNSQAGYTSNPSLLTYAVSLKINSSGNVEAGADNTLSMGTATKRWSVIYAGTGTINTSDAREKQNISELTDAELKVASKLKKLVRRFKFTDAVLAKKDARFHIGVIAQDVIAAFASENLNAFDYGIVCYDKWDSQQKIEKPELNENGEPTGSVLTVQSYTPAGDRYGIRYEELLAFVIAAL